ncbi:MAG: hypothetical protein DHS20C05_01830 [Hyphococcus sp.]|nr:MAG: hypothetical protein DHS20C05_01830 [Marinicaulis sp.]
MLAHLFTGGDDLSALERRKPAQRPSVQNMAADPTHAPAAINTWLEDRFGFRRELIKTDTALRKTFKLRNNDLALRGDDGWLFLSTDNALRMHQGLHGFGPGEEKAWLKGVETIKDAACGKPFVVLIGPNKHTIYPEKLSEFPRQLNDLTRLERLEQLPAEPVRIVSPRKALLAQKETEQVYYQTDSHWTDIGAYTAYRALMAGFSEEGVSAPVLSRERLINNGTRGFIGGTHSMLGVDDPTPETIVDWTVETPSPTRERLRLPAYQWLSFDAFKVRIDNNIDQKLLIYGDSFTFALIPYLQESFGEITYLHYRSGEPPLGAMASCDFDAVALVMVERALSFDMKPQPAPDP